MPFITPAEPAGGGPQPLKSWLASSWDHPITLPTDGSFATAVFDSPADGSFGSDVTESVDGTLFTLVSDGLYSFTVVAYFNTDTGGLVDPGLAVAGTAR